MWYLAEKKFQRLHWKSLFASILTAHSDSFYEEVWMGDLYLPEIEAIYYSWEKRGLSRGRLKKYLLKLMEWPGIPDLPRFLSPTSEPKRPHIRRLTKSIDLASLLLSYFLNSSLNFEKCSKLPGLASADVFSISSPMIVCSAAFSTFFPLIVLGTSGIAKIRSGT